MENIKEHIWKKDDMAICEYINGEFTMGRVLEIHEKENTAEVLLYISGKKIKKVSTEKMTLSLDKLTVPNFIKELNASKKENEGDANEETAKI